MTVIEKAIEFVENRVCKFGEEPSCECERCVLLRELTAFKAKEYPTIKDSDKWNMEGDDCTCAKFGEEVGGKNDIEQSNWWGGFALGWNARGKE